MIDDRPQPARHGKLGKCAACNASVMSHFDTDARFIGCPNVPKDTIFTLVPESGAASASREENASRRSAQARKRGMARARYFASGDVRVDLLPRFTERRRKVLHVIVASGESGIGAREIGERAKLAHGGVQEALAWLRKRNYVIQVDDGVPVSDSEG